MKSYAPPSKASFEWGELRIESGQPVVTLVSRHLEPLRGLRQVFRAWPLVHEQRPDAKLLLVGMEESGGYGIEAASSDSHLTDALKGLEVAPEQANLHVLGVLPHQHMVELLQCSACHVALSYPYTLSWSNLEALACGAPVVTNLGSPLSHELTDGTSGLFCEYNDVRGLAEAILGCLNTPELRQRLSEGGRALAEQRFSQRAVFHCYEELLNELHPARTA